MLDRTTREAVLLDKASSTVEGVRILPGPTVDGDKPPVLSHWKTFCCRLLAASLCVVMCTQTVFATEGHQPVAAPAATSTPPPTLSNFNLDFGFGKEIALTAVAVGAVVGVGLYFLLRKGPGMTGCTVAAGNGLQMKDEADQRVYTLSGRTAALQADHRVRVFGRKQKSNGPTWLFVVRKRSKDLGACTVSH